MVPNFHPGMFPGNNSPPISKPSGSYQTSAYQGVPSAPNQPPHIAQTQPPLGYIY